MEDMVLFNAFMASIVILRSGLCFAMVEAG
jgi:hypothetical protein